MTPANDMTSERQIWEAALLLVRRHGDDAPAVADREALRLGRGADELSAIVWSWIARVSAELIKPEPDPTERIH
jgi:hypothetical protein